MILDKIAEIVAEGWQVQSVWIVPPASHAGGGKGWEAHIKLADYVPGGEGGATDILVEIDRRQIPDGIQITHIEKVADQILKLPAMSEEQAETLAAEIHRAGDASATHKTASGCWAVGPCAAWCRSSLRKAILNSRRK